LKLACSLSGRPDASLEDELLASKYICLFKELRSARTHFSGQPRSLLTNQALDS
jgi:hypothetical protein